MASWKKGSFEIKLGRLASGEHEEVKGFKMGLVGIDKRRAGEYTLTHLPTGLAIKTLIPTLREAKEKGEKISKLRGLKSGIGEYGVKDNALAEKMKRILDPERYAEMDKAKVRFNRAQGAVKAKETKARKKFEKEASGTSNSGWKGVKGFKKGVVNIVYHNEIGHVKATIIWPLAVYTEKDTRFGKFKIIHLPTGFTLKGFDKQKDAKRVAEKLSKIPVLKKGKFNDASMFTSISKKLQAKMKSIVNEDRMVTSGIGCLQTKIRKLEESIELFEAKAVGKSQLLVMSLLNKASDPITITHIHRRPEFRGVHFSKLEKAVETLAKKGLIIYDSPRMLVSLP